MAAIASTSVSTISQQDQQQMTFCEAIEAILDGKAVTRLEWNDQNIVGMLRNGKLMLFRDRTWFLWTVNDGDMLGTDWIVCIE